MISMMRARESRKLEGYLFVYTGLAALFLIVLALARLLLGTLADSTEKTVARQWAATFCSFEELPKRYPAGEDNEVAVLLKRNASLLGIPIAMRREPVVYPPPLKDAGRYSMVVDRVDQYLKQELEKEDESVAAPDGNLAEYMRHYQIQTEQLRDSLIASRPVIWRQNLEWESDGDPDYVLPGLLGIFRVQKLLTACALQQAAKGNHGAAEKYLRASWKLNASLRNRPELHSVLVALSIDSQLLGLIRKLPVDTEWIPVIKADHYRQKLLIGFQTESYYMWRFRHRFTLTEYRMINTLIDPYLRISIADTVENDRIEILRLQSLHPCNLGYQEVHGGYLRPPFPYWNHIAREWWTDKSEYYARLAKFFIDRELTIKIIEAKLGAIAAPGRERSEVFKNGFWVYEKLADGRIAVDYKAPLHFPDCTGINLPRSFTLTPVGSQPQFSDPVERVIPG